MTRDNSDRLELFAESYNIDVRRLALNMDQVDRYGPPPNPAKITDSRAEDYIREFGATSWELDALEPSVIDRLIADEIESIVDADRWSDVISEEREARQRLRKIHAHWQDVASFLDTLPAVR